MGQKVNPHGLRVGVIKGWDTQWYADKKDFGKNIKEDYEIRKFIKTSTMPRRSARSLSSARQTELS